ncbi:hypothetical protein SAMN05192558_112103 [Actinokineospora alba]|uniref:Uncharacterized protein n=1 Tax=Actinokineospora alba TaxID=504798 RepID=A0A1H0UW48_9PSEU|nr:DUF6187 family protein [Actinokineospora alba]TDP69025.1 hypothetical protein C8E96_4596 [Actinokineospora alba]SDI77829.1 hypothetical protein SAMN05421871_107301 [Actinokineospora alba]SDP70285.1 hypothetical protein SAMN05192558_112103 [Actinokineospora alba]
MSDTSFDLPALDDPASTETGIMLLGLDPDRLLACLAVVTLADDAGQVAMLVDHVRHGGAELTMPDLVAAGARRWRSIRPELADADPSPSTSASLRQAWERSHRTLTTVFSTVGPAGVVYLTACWLRRADIDNLVATLGGTP